MIRTAATGFDPFTPAPWARNPHLQTVFASLRLRACGRNRMADCAREVIVEAGSGVRLLGYHSRHEKGSRGLVLLLHGWEGSSGSTYILCTGRFLFDAGFDVFRLNLRDHGGSHHLNEEIFHSARIEEVFNAVRTVSTLSGPNPFSLVGFSLGGNFVLRIALRCTDSDIPPLRQVIAINPVLDPYKATAAIDSRFAVYRNYFLKKWKRSLRMKQTLYPERYDFGEFLSVGSCMEITERLIPKYSPFRDATEYFRTYTLLGDVFRSLSVPVLILMSEDDPIIDVGDFRELRGNGNLRISLQRYGGHCGYLDPFPFGSWSDRAIRASLPGAEKNEGERER
jgi:hypothetical protein